MIGEVFRVLDSKSVDFNQKRTKSKCKNLILCLSEFFATAFLIFFGCMGCATNMFDKEVPHHLIGLSFGFAVAAAVQVFGHISGAHLNPQITIGALILRKIDPMEFPFYIFGQFSGAICGYLALWVIVPESHGLCVTAVSDKLNIYQALVVEATTTGLLVFSCASIWDSKNNKNKDSIPLRLGFIVALLAMVTIPFTGASFNTARSLSPALVNNFWENHWIYWVAPTIGAIVAAVIYRFIFETFGDSDSEDLTESKWENKG